MTATGRRTLRADAARNRELVLEAAERLLRERGLDVTVQEIADEAGVGVGTVMRRFRGKDELVAALVEARMEALLTIVERAIEASEEEPWDAFAAAFTDAVELHVRDRAFMEAVEGSHVETSRQAELGVHVRELLAQLVGRGIEAGVVRDDLTVADVPQLACMVSRASCGSGSDACTSEDGWRRTCAIVLDGMRAR